MDQTIIELNDHFKEIMNLDEYDPEEGLFYINEVMADDDMNDPYLESYQHLYPSNRYTSSRF